MHLGRAGRPASLADVARAGITLVGSQEERAIALADFDCRAAVDYEARLTEELIHLEERFVADNEESLSEFLAAIELTGS